MKNINKSKKSCIFHKTLLTSLLIPLCHSSATWADTISHTDGTQQSISGSYGSDIANQSAVSVKGTGSKITGEADVDIITTARNADGALVTDNGSLDLTDTSITVSGNIAYGVMNNNGTVSLQDGSIASSGESGHGVFTTGTNAKSDIDGTVISTDNTYSHGISGASGGTINLNNAALNASGALNYGIYLTDAETTLIGANNVINNTHGISGYGIYIANGAHANLDNTTIHIDKGNAGVSVNKNSTATLDTLAITGQMTALDIKGTANISNGDIQLDSGKVIIAMGSATDTASVTLTDVVASSLDSVSALVDINNYASITINGGSYYSKGNNNTGLWVSGNTSSLIANNTVVMTEGNGAIGIENRGSALVNNTTVSTKGNNSHGIYTQGATFNASNMDITTAGTGSIAASSAIAGQMNLDNAVIQTSGASGMMLGTFAGSSLNAKNITGTSTGASAYALYTLSNSSISVTDSQFTTEGLNAGGIYANSNSALSSYSQVTLDNSSVVSLQGAGIRASGGNINVDMLNGSQLVGGNGLLVYASTNATNNNASNVNLNVDNHVVLMGDILADENNNINLNMTNNSVWTGAAYNANHIDIDSSSVWNLTGDADAETMHVLGQINFVNSSPLSRTHNFSTLTVTRNLTGNGNLTFNTQLGDSNSPTDRLHIMGNATGAHTVTVINQNGLGAQTTGSGINLITVDGDTSTGRFTMNDGVVAGAYQYLLYKVDANNWNLQSNLINGDTEEVAYRPDVPGYIAAPWLNALYGFVTLGRLHERRSVLESANNSFNQASWGRVSGVYNKFDAGRFSYDSDIEFIQLGHDFYQAESASGTKATAGAMFTLGKHHTDTQDKARALHADLSIDTGKIKTEAYGLGGYYTLISQDGGYLDLVGQGTLYRNDYESDVNAKQTGSGVVVSVEAGQVYPISDDWKIEPQGQVKYQYLNLRNSNDALSTINSTQYSIGQARAGLRLLQDIGKEQVVNPYFTSDVVYQLGKNPEVSIDNTTIRPEFSKSYWQTGAGVIVRVNDSTDIYADVKYQKAFNNNMDGYSGNLGIKVSF
ncbi:outer membrane autotransporter barrel domain protein [Yersinia rohdei]|uniref:Outer membrane autotransporter barrel domain protein n=1 Tax=Yersinia rohdei TaxID=29485 RepID=A0ABM5SG49_YERRO|nr:autotransporter outer membrane beta-barrel domain-containing protein [Yersinia rohdei]AJJ12231.1 outer membrane autotransporter barrel domain protein [Yersinia rohdei]